MQESNPQLAWLQQFSAQSQKQLQQLMSSNGMNQEVTRQLTEAWQTLMQHNLDNPLHWWQSLGQLQQKQLQLWQQWLTGEGASSKDKRFQDKSWQEQPIFDYIKQSYLLTANFYDELTADAPLEPRQKQLLNFYTRQFVDAMSPSNFAHTNPEVIQAALESKGQTLLDGMQNLLNDLEKGRISMTDESAFELGSNLAVTPGEVIFQNDLIQVIEYRPSTAEVSERPLLIVPPCINKFYILDLQPDNSFVKFCVDQGQHTFLISWANPTAEQRHLSWEDYLERGIFKAIEVVQAVHPGDAKLNAVAWCVGGTLLASAMAVMAVRGDERIGSATFLTTLTDFSDPGELSVFIDQEQIKHLEQRVQEQGVLSGRDLAATFNLLRANDLIWSYVVNNYLKGKQPAAFDILYWNSDPTNLAADMYSFYINNMYLQNKLVQPGGLQLCGEAVDLSKIKQPCYFLSTIDDHIAPWKTTYKGASHFGGNVEFILGASGHVAGVINPASKNRRHFWTNANRDQDAEKWLASAEQQPGSWWNHWKTWLKRRAGKNIPAPSQPGNEQYPALEAAPGSYVKVRL